MLTFYNQTTISSQEASFFITSILSHKGGESGGRWWGGGGERKDLLLLSCDNTAVHHAILFIAMPGQRVTRCCQGKKLPWQRGLMVRYGVPPEGECVRCKRSLKPQARLASTAC